GTNLTSIENLSVGAASTITYGTTNWNTTGSGSADTFSFTLANFSASDTIDGGNGTDTLDITDGGTFNIGTLGTNLTSVENLSVGAASTITYGTTNFNTTGSGSADTFTFTLANFSASDTIDGGVGTDTLNISDGGTFNIGTLGTNLTSVENLTVGAASDITFGTGNWNTTGSGGDDIFSFALANFTSADTIAGGLGTDTLAISDGGTFNIDTLAANVTGVENLTVGAASTITYGATNWNTTGSGSADTFSFTLTNFGASDTIAGGLGTDILNISDGGTFDIGTLAVNVTAVENLTVGAASTITYGTANFSTTGSSSTDTFSFALTNFSASDTIAGGLGTDTLNISDGGTFNIGTLGANLSSIENLTVGAASDITYGTTNFNTTGSSSADIFSFTRANFTSADTIDGSGGTDTLTISDGGTFNIGTLAAKVSAVENLTVGAASTITYGTTNWSTTGSGSADTFSFTRANFTSADTIDGSGGTDTLTISDGGTFDIGTLATNVTSVENLTVGAASTITYGTANFNTTGSGSADTFTFALADFSASDTIAGGLGTDILNISDGGTFNIGTLGASLTSIENLTVGAASTITYGTANFSTTGSGSDDTFSFALTNFSASDTIAGGLGTDTLNISDGGTFNIGTLAANVSAVENLTVGAASTITYGTANWNTTGSGSADTFSFTRANFTSADTIDGSGGTDTLTISDGGTFNIGTLGASLTSIENLTVGAASTITYGTANFSTTGSGSADTFTFALADFSASDTIAGGLGTDILNISDGGTFDIGTLAANVTAVENLTVGAASTITYGTTNWNTTGSGSADTFSFTLTNFSASDTIAGGSGSDTLNISDGGTFNIGTLGASLTSVENLTVGAASTITYGTTNFNTTGSSSADTFSFTRANFTSADTIDGSGGTDTLTISDGGTFNIGTLGASLTSIENLTVGAASTITYGTANWNTTGSGSNDTFSFAAANFSSADTIDGGNGTDTLSISDGGTINLATLFAGGNLTSIEAFSVGAASDITVGTTNMSITGSSSNDTFRFAATDLSSADTLDGGLGTDTLAVSGAEAIDVSNVTGIENITFDSVVDITLGSTNFNLTSSGSDDTFRYALANFSSADTINGGLGTDTLAITDGGTFNIGTLAANVSAVENLTVGTASDITFGTANWNTTGSSENDTFRFAAANLTSADTLDGGLGTDTLVVTTSGTINISNVTAIENITFNGATDITLSTTNFNLTGSTSNDIFRYALASFSASDTIDGGNGTDTLVITDGGTFDIGTLGANLTSVENLTVGAAADITFGTGNFATTGSSSNDIFNFDAANLTSADTVNGNGGTDTLAVTGTGTIDIRNITDVDNLTLASATNVTYGTNNFSTTGSTGNDSFIFAGSNFSSADSINGNGGTDTLSITGGGTIDLVNVVDVDNLTLTGATDVTYSTANYNTTGSGSDDTFSFTMANLSSADTIAGGLGTDTLNISDGGTFNLSTLVSGLTNISGIERLSVGAASTITMGATNFSTLGSSGNDTFIFTRTNFTSADTIDGGLGTDTLNISDGGTFDIGTLGASLSSIENLTVGAASTITYGTANFNTTGSTGNDTFTFAASNLTSADTIVGNGGTDIVSITGGGSADITNVTDVDTIYAIGVDLTVGSGNFSINGGIGSSETFRFTNANFSSADTINGGGFSSDTLVITDGGTFNIGTQGVNLWNILNLQVGAAATITYGTADWNTTGSSGNDTFIFTLANVGSWDVIDGGLGTDTLTISDGGTFNIGTLSANLTSVENLTVGAAATITYGTGNWNTTGSTGNDTFTFAASNLTSADTIDGNGGTDTVSITGGGSADVTNVTDVDKITLAAATDLTIGSTNFSITGSTGNDTFRYTNANFSSADTINGSSGTGDKLIITDGDTIDLTTINVSSVEVLEVGAAATITYGATNYSTTGSSGDDIFTFTVANFSASDTINAGAGSNDQLRFTTAGTISSAALANVTNLEEIRFDTGANSLTLADFFVSATDGIEIYSYGTSLALSITNVTNTKDIKLMTAGAYDLASGGSYKSRMLLEGSGVYTIDGTAVADIYIMTSAVFALGQSIDGSGGGDLLAISDSATIDLTGAVATNLLSQSKIALMSGGSITTSDTVVTNKGFQYYASGGALSLDTGATASSYNVMSTGTITLHNSSNNAITIANLADSISPFNGFSDLSPITSVYTGGTVISGAGSDTILGGTGADFITLGGGSDSVQGGSGNDTFYVTAAGLGSDTIRGFDSSAGAGGTDTITLTGGGTFSFASSTIVSIEQVTFDDTAATVTMYNGVTTITGGNGGNTITLGTGGQIITVGSGADSITGNTGNDSITGGGGDDTLNGAAGVDSIAGGTGSDMITGGAGADQISLGSNDSTVDYLIYNDSTEGGDTVSQFEVGTDKVIFTGPYNTQLDDITNDDDITWVSAAAVNFSTTHEGIFISGLSDANAVSTASVATAVNGYGVTATAGADGIIVVQGATQTAVYVYTEFSTNNNISSGELTHLGTVSGLLTINDFDFM
ncbi:MAG: putative rane anchored cell surface hemagglutinin, partial [Rickettsiales bacterium]|nr:putative rane anchored cell surface hemagglutinin [Rickettsiales bacterium]